MTYMHMFRQYGDLTDGWDIFTRDVRRVLDAAFATDHIRFTGPDGVGNPVVDGDHISFNGSLRQFIMRDGRRVGSSDGPCDITRRAAQAWGRRLRFLRHRPEALRRRRGRRLYVGRRALAGPARGGQRRRGR